LPVTAQVTHAPEPVPAQPDTPPPATPTTGAPTAEAEAEASKPAEEPKPRLTASQQVAQAVLATRAANAGSSTTFLGGLLGKNKVLGKNEASAVNPLLAAGGGKENPVYVTLSERKHQPAQMFFNETEFYQRKGQPYIASFDFWPS